MTHLSFIRFLAVAATIAAVVSLSGCRMSPEAKAQRALKRAAALTAEKDYRRAVIEFQNAAQALPQDAELQYRLGMAYIPLKEYVRAAAHFRRATELDPAHKQAQLKLAELLSLAGEDKLLDDVEQQLESVLAGDPGNLEAITALVVTELRQGKEADAVKRLEETLEKFPAHLRSAVTLARLKIVQKDWPAAEDALKGVVQAEPRSSSAALSLGQFYAIAGKPDFAEQQFARALELDPKNAAALTGLGSLLLQAGKTAEAEKIYTRIAALPDERYSHMHAVFLFHTGRHVEALKELHALYKASPDSRIARNRLVAALIAVRQPKAAEQILDEALKRNPKDLGALVARGQLRLGFGRLEDAERDARQVLTLETRSAFAHFTLAGVERRKGRQTVERHELSEALRLDPSLLAARLRLAEILLAGDPKSARELLEQAPPRQRMTLPVITAHNWALVLLGDQTALRQGLREGFAMAKTPELVLQDGYLKLAEGQHAAASAAAEAVLKFDSSDVRAVQLLARSYAARKQLVEAARKVAEIAVQHPKHCALHSLAAQWHLRSGNRAEARKSLLQAREANRSEIPPLLGLADLDLEERQHESARRFLAEALAADPRNTAVLLRLAQLEEALGRSDAAIQVYQAVLGINPQEAVALNNLAYHLAAKRPDDALVHARKAIEIDSRNPLYHDTIGWIYFHKGMYAVAAQHLEVAAEKAPTPRHRYHLAAVYMKTGNTARARQMMDAAIKEDPSLVQTERF